MPQAIDLAASLQRSSAPPARQSTSASAEPVEKFDDVLDRQTSRKAGRSEQVRETDKPKPAAKAERKSKSDDAPVDEAEPADKGAESDVETKAAEGEEQHSDPSGDESAGEQLWQQDENPSTNGDEEVDGNGISPEMIQALLPENAIQQPGVQPVADEKADTLAEPIASATTSTLSAQAMAADSSADGGESEAEQDGSIKLPTIEASDEEGDLADVVPTGAKLTSDALASLPADDTPDSTLTQALQAPAVAKAPVAQPVTPVQPPPAPVAPEQHFAEHNVDRIVSGVKTELLPNGGTMKMRLDPGNLGQIQIEVTVDEGVLTASFQTSNDEATRLLSHNLQNLKNTLETAGVVVDRIQVKQASASEQSSSSSNGNSDQRDQQQNPHDHPSRQEQERREMLQKMWAKLALGEEPLDLVA